MPVQIGRCAYAAACTMPGPRIRMGGTQRVFCGFHARTLAIAIDNPMPVTDIADAAPKNLQILATSRTGGKA